MTDTKVDTSKRKSSRANSSDSPTSQSSHSRNSGLDKSSINSEGIRSDGEALPSASPAVTPAATRSLLPHSSSDHHQHLPHLSHHPSDAFKRLQALAGAGSGRFPLVLAADVYDRDYHGRQPFTLNPELLKWHPGSKFRSKKMTGVLSMAIVFFLISIGLLVTVVLGVKHSWASLPGLAAGFAIALVVTIGLAVFVVVKGCRNVDLLVDLASDTFILSRGLNRRSSWPISDLVRLECHETWEVWVDYAVTDQGDNPEQNDDRRSVAIARHERCYHSFTFHFKGEPRPLELRPRSRKSANALQSIVRRIERAYLAKTTVESKVENGDGRT